MPTELEIKIQQLRQIYTFDQDKMMASDLENRLAKADMLKDLKNLDGIKELLKEIETEIENITTLLAWDREMPEDERKYLFVKRETYIWFYSFFNDPSKTIEKIRLFVEGELKS